MNRVLSVLRSRTDKTLFRMILPLDRGIAGGEVVPALHFSREEPCEPLQQTLRPVTGPHRPCPPSRSTSARACAHHSPVLANRCRARPVECIGKRAVVSASEASIAADTDRRPILDRADPRPAARTRSEAHAAVSGTFIKPGGTALDHLENCVFPDGIVNGMLAGPRVRGPDPGERTGTERRRG